MRVPDRFLRVVREGWQVWAMPGWLPQVGAIIERAHRADEWVYQSKHARTRRLDLPGAPPAFLKAYRPYRWTGVLKDAVRPSKALRALVMSGELERAGLAAARVLAAGERRRFGILRGAFLVTEELDAPDVRDFIGALAAGGSVKVKRCFLGMLGRHVARLHEAGFCHGDLVPTNVRVRGGSVEPEIVLLDNDRTCMRSRPVRLRQARRNLVQLNRFVVKGLTAADRWRAFRAYCASRHLDHDETRHLGRWVINKTIERRRRFDGIEAAGRMSFRALMRVPDPQFPQSL
jgi:hypothetical protein